MMIFAACLLTVIIETPFLALCGHRKADDIVIIICANVVSNLLLNLFVAFVMPDIGNGVYLLEVIVVFFEYAVYAIAFGRSLKLFTETFSANLISYCLGLLIF